MNSSPTSSEPPLRSVVSTSALAAGVPESLWTRAFLRVCLIQVTFGFAFSTFFLLPKFLAQELGATPLQIGNVTGVNVFAAVLGIPCLWLAIDRVPRHHLLVFGTLLGAGAALGHVWVTEIGPLLYVLRALQGVAFVTTFNTAATLAVELSPPQRLSQSLGFFGIASLCTNAAAPALVEPLVQRFGWSLGFEVAAAFALIAAWLSMKIAEPKAPRAHAPVERRALLDRRAVTIYYASALTGLGFGTLITYAQPFALSLGASAVSQLFVGYAGAAVAVRIVLGSLADRIGRRVVALASLVLYGLVLLVTARLEPSWLFGIGLGLGVAHGLLYPSLNALLVESTPVAARGVVMITYNGAFNLGFAVSVVSFGAVAEVTGYPSVFLVAGLAIFSGAAALALLPAAARATHDQQSVPPRR
ncbi:MAG TPA: MFS transporter [Polyangiaceae bacterium]|nr:MFS transporter [Polyangiaceae bacterium]